MKNSNIESRFPGRVFCSALNKFLRARRAQKEEAFQAALQRAVSPEEAHLLFVWTRPNTEFNSRAYAHWEVRSYVNAQALRREGHHPWQVFRYFHGIAPSGAVAERLLEIMWEEHPIIQKWLLDPVGAPLPV